MAIDHTRYLMRAHPSSLIDLVVSPERARWIQERYPESDVGRPGILFSEPSSLRPLYKKDPVGVRLVQNDDDEQDDVRKEEEYSELQIVTEEEMRTLEMLQEDTRVESELPREQDEETNVEVLDENEEEAELEVI